MPRAGSPQLRATTRCGWSGSTTAIDPEVERVSGQGLVPVIDDDGTVVADSPRILAYLDARYPEPSLYPSAPARRAEVEIFIDWFNHVWKRWPNGIDAELNSEAPDHALIDEHAAQMAAFLSGSAEPPRPQDIPCRSS